MNLHYPSQNIWHPFPTVKSAPSDCPITNQKRWVRLVFSLLMSLVAHAIVVEKMAHRTNDGDVIRAHIRSTSGIPASLIVTTPQPAPKATSSVSRSFDNTEKKHAAPGIVDLLTEETREEPLYVSPDSVEQLASVIEVPDLPLPPDSFNPEGLMRIKVFVNQDGFADNVELLESDFAEDYSSTLVQLFKSAKFSPGVLGGKTIKSWRIVEINYSSS